MSFRDGPLQDLKVPLAFAGGAAAIIAVVAALFFLVEDRAPAPRAALTGVVRSRFDQTMGPISAGLAAPVRWMLRGVVRKQLEKALQLFAKQLHGAY